MNIHDTDFYSWTQQQVTLLRERRLDELDIDNLMDEIADMGRSEKRELEHRLAVLLAHLLKWCYQAGHRSNSWRFTIEVQRQDAREVLVDNSGLKHKLDEILTRAYRQAKVLAIKATGLTPDAFPATNPWDLTQIFADDFWPET